MGVLTDIVIANKSDANKLTEQLYNHEFVSEDNNGLMLEMLVVLFAILSDRPMNQELTDEFVLLSAEDIEVGPWAYKLPDAFVDILAQIKDDEFAEIAEDWADSVREELPFITGRSLDLCNLYLESLRRLSKEVLRDKKSLFLRVCL